MRTKHLFVLIHIIRARFAPSNMFMPYSEYFLQAVPRSCFFVDFFCYLCFISVMLSCRFLAALWSGLNFGSFVSDVLLCFCHFYIWCLGSGVEFDCIDF